MQSPTPCVGRAETPSFSVAPHRLCDSQPSLSCEDVGTHSHPISPYRLPTQPRQESGSLSAWGAAECRASADFTSPQSAARPGLGGRVPDAVKLSRTPVPDTSRPRLDRLRAGQHRSHQRRGTPRKECAFCWGWICGRPRPEPAPLRQRDTCASPFASPSVAVPNAACDARRHPLLALCWRMVEKRVDVWRRRPHPPSSSVISQIEPPPPRRPYHGIQTQHSSRPPSVTPCKRRLLRTPIDYPDASQLPPPRGPPSLPITLVLSPHASRLYVCCCSASSGSVTYAASVSTPVLVGADAATRTLATL